MANKYEYEVPVLYDKVDADRMAEVAFWKGIACGVAGTIIVLTIVGFFI